MIVNNENFVGVYDNVFSPEYCDKIIDYYEWSAKNNRIWPRTENDTIKKDNSCTLNPTSSIDFPSEKIDFLINEFNAGFWDVCYKDYRETYGILNDLDRHTIFTYKVQKTLPAEGYHIWHCENGEKCFNSRIAVYTLYLNDVKEGGETEFLYLSKRVSAKKGRLIIWPANFPWTHRGNPPLSGEKYIMTGWVEFC